MSPVSGKPGRRWVEVGVLPRAVQNASLTDLVRGLVTFGVLELSREREYRLSWDGDRRRWVVSTR